MGTPYRWYGGIVEWFQDVTFTSGTTVTYTNGTLNVTAGEAADSTLQLWADDGDDTADKWALKSVAADNDLDIVNGSTVVASITSGGAISSISSIKSSAAAGGIGYATGAGGTVTQATDKSTAVALNKLSGAITMNNAQLDAGVIVSFTLTNTSIAATDVLILNHISGGTVGSYLLNAQAAAGSATINVRNTTGGNLSEAVVIQFAVIKGVNA